MCCVDKVCGLVYHIKSVPAVEKQTIMLVESWRQVLQMGNCTAQGFSIAFFMYILHFMLKNRSSCPCLCYSSGKLLFALPFLLSAFFNSLCRKIKLGSSPCFSREARQGLLVLISVFQKQACSFLSVNLSKDLTKIQHVIFQSSKVLMKQKIGTQHF